MKKITTILIGAGNRGKIYTDYALTNPDKLKVIGIVEPTVDRRESFAEKHNISAENCFTDWEELFKREKFANTVMICTQDKMHFAPAMAAIEKGYDILLEKPISPILEECTALANAAEGKGVKVVVCHILRYTPFFSELKRIIDSGEIGELVSLVHNENVGNIHYSHSYVRGNWRNKSESAPMILAKACHDTDIIQWLIGKKCLRLSSFGSLKYFNKKNCPDDAPKHCLDGCPHSVTCPYDAKKLYIDDNPYKDWFRGTSAASVHATDEQVYAALRTGAYGRCVFKCDNDVVDHQTVNMEFEDGVTAIFSMCAFTPEISRSIKIMGTKGQIKGHMGENSIIVTDFLSQKEREIKIDDIGGHVGHGGGDVGIMQAFCEYIANGYSNTEISDVRISEENHMISFAAEESRLSGGKVLEL